MSPGVTYYNVCHYRYPLTVILTRKSLTSANLSSHTYDVGVAVDYGTHK